MSTITPDPLGVTVVWSHTCGHDSTPMLYAGTKYAEADRWMQESQPCWACRNSALIEQDRRKREGR